jgi:hypothetical protein
MSIQSKLLKEQREQAKTSQAPGEEEAVVRNAYGLPRWHREMGPNEPFSTGSRRLAAANQPWIRKPAPPTSAAGRRVSRCVVPHFASAWSGSCRPAGKAQRTAGFFRSSMSSIETEALWACRRSVRGNPFEPHCRPRQRRPALRGAGIANSAAVGAASLSRDGVLSRSQFGIALKNALTVQVTQVRWSCC